MISIWDYPKTLDELELERASKRREGRITFDCFNAKTETRGRTNIRVYCSEGKRLSSRTKDGSIGIITVLQGNTPEVCKNCPDYNSDKEGE